MVLLSFSHNLSEQRRASRWRCIGGAGQRHVACLTQPAGHGCVLPNLLMFICF